MNVYQVSNRQGLFPLPEGEITIAKGHEPLVITIGVTMTVALGALSFLCVPIEGVMSGVVFCVLFAASTISLLTTFQVAVAILCNKRETV